MLYFITSILLVLVYLLLTLTVTVNIFPEFFFLPWLVAKGILPYRDFFDHHGPLSYFLLSQLSLDKSQNSISFFYLFIQLANLVLFLILLKKIASRLNFLLIGLIYVLLNYYLSGNTISYETLITILFLISYFLLQFKKKLALRNFAIGTLISLASLIKPTASLVIFPLLFQIRKPILFVYFLIPWAFVSVYYFFHNGLFQLLSNLFFFNIHYVSYVRQFNPFFLEKTFFQSSLFIVIICLFLLLLNKKIFKNIFSILFLIFSLIFIFPNFMKVNLIPASPFFLLLLATTLKDVRLLHSHFLFIILILFSVFLMHKVSRDRSLYLNKSPYIENNSSKIIAEKLRKKAKRNIYILGNPVEIYYFIDQLPPTYFPLVFPWISNFFSVEEKIIEDIKRKNIDCVVIPKPEDTNYQSFKALKKYIKSKYLLEEKNPEFNLYC